MITLFNIWTKQASGKFTRQYMNLAFCDAEMVAVCLGIDQALFTAFATNANLELLGPQLPQKDIAIYKCTFLDDVPAVPLENQINYLPVPACSFSTLQQRTTIS